MLDYSLTAFQKIKKDFLRIKRFFDVVIPLFPIAFLTYSVITTAIDKSFMVWVNALSLLLAVAYYIFHLFVTFRKTDKELKKAVKTAYKICVRAIKFFTLAVTLYGLWISIDDVNPLSMILTILSLVGWLLQVVLDIILHIINSYANFIKEAIMADIEELKKPVTTVSNFFKKMTGKEVEEKEVSKTREKLDELVSERKEEIKNLKMEAKEQKKQEKLEERERRRQERQNKNQDLDENEVAVSDSEIYIQDEDENTKSNPFAFLNRWKKK